MRLSRPQFNIRVHGSDNVEVSATFFHDCMAIISQSSTGRHSLSEATAVGIASFGQLLFLILHVLSFTFGRQDPISFSLYNYCTMARVNRVLPLQAPRKRLRNETAPRPRSTDNVKTLLKRSHRSPLAVTNHKAGAVKNQAPRVDKHVRISGASVRHDERRRQPSKRSEETAISLRFSGAPSYLRKQIGRNRKTDGMNRSYGRISFFSR